MAYTFDKNAHSVYTLNYHLVQCIKYRRKALDFPEIIEELKQRTKSIAESYGCEILAIETDLDHVHILFKAKPQTDLLKFINLLCFIYSREFKTIFPILTKHQPGRIIWE